MDPSGLFLLPRADDHHDMDLREVEVAIEMVARGAAVRVRLVGLDAADDLAAVALARAQQAGVGFRVDHMRGMTRLTFGSSD